MKQSSSDQSKIYLPLIDIIFGVIIGASFISLSKNLVPVKSTLTPFYLDFEQFTIGTAYLIIILSWIFYHEAVKKREPQLNLRFAIDLILLYLYFYILFSFEKISDYVFTVLLMFLLYLAWSVKRDSEEWIEKNWKKYYSVKLNLIKLIRTIGISICSLVLWIIYDNLTVEELNQEVLLGLNSDWLAIIFIMIFVIAYRFPNFYDLIKNRKKQNTVTK